MIGNYHGALGDTSTGLTVFHYGWTSNLYYFGRRWGSAAFYEKDFAGRLVKLGQYFNTAPGTTESTFAYNPASQIRSETRTSDSYAWTGGVAVERHYSVNGLADPKRSAGMGADGGSGARPGSRIRPFVPDHVAG